MDHRIAAPISLKMDEHGTVDTEITIPYKDTLYSFIFHQRKKVVMGAEKSERTLTYPAEYTEHEFFYNSYSMFALDSEQQESLSVFVNELSSISEKKGFTNNEFVEFIASYVQNLTYDYMRARKKEFKLQYPVETMAKGSGVCSDFSILLASLLATAGYNSAYVTFPKHAHAVCGIQSSNIQHSFRNTGWVLIETTCQAPIGKIESEYKNPDIYPVGHGTKVWEVH